MTAAMRATRRPYSTPAAPVSSAKKVLSWFCMAGVPCLARAKSEGVGDGGEAGLHLAAEGRDGADDDGGDEGDEEAVFDTGGTGLVGEEGLELVQHGRGSLFG